MQVTVSARILTMPRACACCFGQPDRTLLATNTRTGKKGENTRGWEFPFCTFCAIHLEKWNAATRDAKICTWLGIAAAVLFLWFSAGEMADGFRSVGVLTIMAGGWFTGMLLRSIQPGDLP